MLSGATSRANDPPKSPELSTSVQKAINRARLVVGRFDASWSTALARTDQAMMKALGAVYDVCIAIDRQPRQREAFLSSARVSPHGNVRNSYQPIVRALLKDCHGDLRARITRYAGVVALARSDKVPSKAFTRFVQHEHGGIAAAYKEFVRRQRIPREQLQRLKERKAAVDGYLQSGTNENFPIPARMEKRAGIALAVIEIADGNFRLLRVLDQTPEEIERLVEHQARRWASQARK